MISFLLVYEKLICGSSAKKAKMCISISEHVVQVVLVPLTVGIIVSVGIYRAIKGVFYTAPMHLIRLRSKKKSSLTPPLDQIESVSEDPVNC